MKFTSSLAAISLASNAFAAYVGSTYWTTMTPSYTLDGALTSYSATFGIAVEPLETGSTVSASLNVEKRQVVSQIGDGQIQATTDTEKETSKSSTSTAAAVVSQITDGQIQATTATTTSSSSSSKKTDAEVVSQIDDGQIQATTSTSSKKTAADVVTQIGDGQIQATSKSSTSTAADVVSQITDGQIQATSTKASSATTSGVISQISDGQIQASSTASSKTSSASASTATGDYVTSVSCKKEGALAMTLKDGILYDSEGRIGSIVANRQFQFDGPPPQAGAIYADGWSISPEGYLAIGNNTIFYQCLSGTFYNLYDQSIGGQCNEVHLKAVELVDC
ncbi:hypothetical protein KL905_003651 [Ogataea polymorpha]|uniref:Cell wall mannoprotein PIR1-like C-terminal domain-containing protein n=2 Tax=Saccharomycotina TaxID=147537 RepID=A0A9P8NUY7_9ASCO|nr:hypothetical protein KL936_003837 [Ogataea polymorpha]KAG7892016.1 hypothetical protein KL908_003621 [Ogataea polymorpha]KAG7899273.1 hypothetical protein KL935_003583 [Ogataea polymorpha]KAG7919786.1 hypothetical protein KL905_003651 [Ogataea polymorpha]KAH3659874.1 hypothetical protein OGATHE_005919 [Ogataea polymorpha]